MRRKWEKEGGVAQGGACTTAVSPHGLGWVAGPSFPALFKGVVQKVHLGVHTDAFPPPSSHTEMDISQH